MLYESTRGCAPDVSFLDAVSAGLAPDGGLYVPKTWPELPNAILVGDQPPGFVDASAAALALFAGKDLTPAAALGLAERAYGPQGRFAHTAVAPLVQLGDRLWLQELFHGPSLAFKDVAMQLIGVLLQQVLSASDRRLSVLCATSGDTGGAAAEAFRMVDRSDLFILLPKGRVSEVQRRFMTASGAGNVFPIIIDSDFDACQAIVKTLFADAAFAQATALTAVNSISWARIVAQTAYYITSACALGRSGPVDYVVPTGNMGDGFAGFVAKLLGAPVGRILIATNANDILTRALNIGRYARAAASAATISPAMDIQVASNFERLLFVASGRDADQTRNAYDGFATSGGFDIDEATLAQAAKTFSAVAVDDAETLAAMRAAYAETGEVLCPHSAVALAAARKGAPDWKPDGQVVVLATAHPAKFPETVQQALKLDAPLPARCADLFERPEVFASLPADAGQVADYIKAHSRAHGA